MPLFSLYQDLLNQLEQLSKQAPELITDADVRERIQETLNWYLVHQHPITSDFPQLYGMHSAKADKALAKLITGFIKPAQILATDMELEARYLVLINEQLLTATGLNYQHFFDLPAQAPAPEKPVADWLYGDYDD